MNEEYQREKKQYNLQACCEECSHYCEQRNKCGMLYPVEPHLSETVARSVRRAHSIFARCLRPNDDEKNSDR